jgi:hypothetical protein
MSQYKVHVYIVKEEPYDHNRYVYVRREDLETGEFAMLRAGATTWPESIVKTCVQVGVPAALYMITEEQTDLCEWDQAELIPEESW